MLKTATIYPTQWVETDKNAHKRRANKEVAPELKSRLVGCGNFEEQKDYALIVQQETTILLT